MVKSRENSLLLALIIGIGALLRLYDLGTKDIWFDESLSLLKSLLSVHNILIDAFGKMAPDVQPHLYALFMHFWVRPGMSEGLVRLPSALAGILSIYVFYLVARMLCDQRTAVIAAFLASISPFLIALSQEARMYSFHLLFTLSMLYFFLKFRDGRQWRISLLLYALFALLNLFTHYVSLFYVFFLNLYFLVFYRSDRRHLARWLSCQAVIGALFMREVPHILQQKMRVALSSGGAWIPETGGEVFCAMFYNWNFSSLQLWGNPLYPVVNRTWAAAVIVLLASWGIFRGCDDRRKAWFIAGWFFAPLVIAAAATPMVRICVDRYFIALIPALLLAAAMGIVSLKKAPLRISALAVLVLFSFCSLSLYYGKMNIPPSQQILLFSLKGQKDFRGPSSFLRQEAGKDDVILIEDAYVYFPLFYYNFDMKDRIGYVKTPRVVRNDALNRAPRVYLVHSTPPGAACPFWETGPLPVEMSDSLSESHMLEKVQHFSGIDVYVFKKRAVPGE